MCLRLLRRVASTREALPDVLLHLRPLDVFARTRLVGNGKWRLRRLALTRLLLRSIEVLRHALIHDLIIEDVHDLCEGLACHRLAVDGLHNPTALHARCEGLALGVSWVPRLRDDLHDHGVVAAGAWGIADDSKGPLLVGHPM